MTRTPTPQDRKPQDQDREDRLAAALRANLARRKAQARARAAQDTDPTDAPDAGRRPDAPPQAPAESEE